MSKPMSDETWNGAPRTKIPMPISKSGTTMMGAFFDRHGCSNDGGDSTTMMLRIACPCGHTGIVSAESLPRSLTCSRCGSCRYVKAEDGTRIVNRVAFEEWLFGASGAPRVTERKL